MTISRRHALRQIGGVTVLGAVGCVGREEDLPGTLRSEWVSDTATAYRENHHEMAVTSVDGMARICLPRNGLDREETCGVVVLDETGNILWRDSLAPEHCNAHAIGDVRSDDLDGDERSEFLVASEAEGIVAYDASTGEETFHRDAVDAITYSAPLATDLSGDGTPELVMVDFAGNLSVFNADGSVAWTQDELRQPVYVNPLVADFTGGGSPNIAVHHGRDPSEVACLNAEGDPVWRTSLGEPSLSWALVDRDPNPAIATTDGDGVTLLPGADGEPRWHTTLLEGLREIRLGGVGSYLYAGASDGTLRAVDPEDGSIAWTANVSAGERMPPPTLGSFTGGAATDVAAAAYDGTVVVCDAKSGELLGRHQADHGIYTPLQSADVTGEGPEELLALYGNAQVGAFSYERRD